MDADVKFHIDILLKEYESLQIRDRQLTAFYHRFATIGTTLVGAVFYYATTYKPPIHHAVPFLVSSLVLFLEFWRMDTVATNTCMNQLARKINELAEMPLLISTKIEVAKFLRMRHKGTGAKIVNPMFLLIILISLIFAAIIILSYRSSLEYFEVNKCWPGYPIIYSILSMGLLLYTAIVVLILELGSMQRFWERVVKWEFNGEESRRQ